MSLIVESPTDEALGECLDLIKLSVEKLAGEYYSQEQLEAWISQYPEREVFLTWRRRRMMFVARDEDRLVGFGQVDFGRREIESVHVAPDRVRDGIGTQLVAEMEKVAVETGLGELQVQSSLNATDFYEACGYSAVRQIKFQCRNGVSLDALLMQRSLADVR